MLRVTTGPMFAGKSSALYSDLFGIPNEMRIIFKPSNDTRDPDHIVLHHGGKLSAVSLDPFEGNLSVHLNDDIRHVFIDEIQFFKPWIIREIYDLVMNRDICVHVYGLDITWDGKPWHVTSHLLALADEVVKLKAYCVKCGHRASKTTRTSSSTDLILVGEAEAYEPRCNRHFE